MKKFYSVIKTKQFAIYKKELYNIMSLFMQPVKKYIKIL